MLIDEVQYAPNLLPLIKLAVDQSRRPGEFWLTGSQPFHLMQGWRSRPTRDAIRHFEVLPRLGMPIGHGALVCLVSQALPISSTVTMLPCVF